MAHLVMARSSTGFKYGVKSMLDDLHLAVKGDFSGEMTLRPGMTFSAPVHSNGEQREQDTIKYNVQFVMKLDVSTELGIGDGTTGWARVLDENVNGDIIHPGGVDPSATGVAGDKDGNMIVTYTGYESYNASAPYVDRYRRPKCCGKMIGPGSWTRM